MHVSGASKQSTQSLKKAVQLSLEQQSTLPDLKVVDAADAAQLARSLCSLTPKPVSWRSSRSYVVADSVVVQHQSSEGVPAGDQGLCSVQVSGYLRGAPMSVHSLMHILGVGTGKVVCAWAATPAEKHRGNTSAAVGAVGQLSTVPGTALLADPSR